MQKRYGQFLVDFDQSSPEYIAVDIAGVGTVLIKHQEGEGIVVDLFPLAVSDEPVAGTWATYGDLIDE